MTETWRPVLGFEGIYEVSDNGRVRRSGSGPGASVGKILGARLNRKGYHHVALHAGRLQERMVHRLVLEAFVGVAPAGHEGNHKNGIKGDNRLANLEWMLPVENMRHARENGLRPSFAGERNGRSKLTADQVRKIRAAEGTNLALAAEYGVSDQVISGIRRRIYWRHV